MKYFPEDFKQAEMTAPLDSVERRRLEYFFEQYVIKYFDWYKFGHWALACYASLSPVVTPDLLHALWLNFKRYHYRGDEQGIHPVAPADLLLSPLFEEIGHELYEMAEPVRFALLQFLQNNSSSASRPLELKPLESIAEFLLA